MTGRNAIESAECDRKRAVDACKLFFPVAAAKGNGSHFYAVLVEGHRQMMACRAHAFRLARESDFAGAKHGARIAVSKRG